MSNEAFYGAGADSGSEPDPGASAASGAATGAAVAGPWGAVIGGVAGFAGSAMAGSAPPSSADAIFGTNLNFDNSGWNVAFPGSTIDSKSDKTTSQSTPGSTGSKQATNDMLMWALLFVGALVAFKALKK